MEIPSSLGSRSVLAPAPALFTEYAYLTSCQVRGRRERRPSSPPPPLRPLLHIPKRRPAYSEITQVSHPRVARTLTEKGNRSFAGEKSIFEISRGKRILSSVSAVFRINRRRRIDRSFSGKKLASSQRTITFVCSIDKQKPTHECMYSINNN